MDEEEIKAMVKAAKEGGKSYSSGDRRLGSRSHIPKDAQERLSDLFKKARRGYEDIHGVGSRVGKVAKKAASKVTGGGIAAAIAAMLTSGDANSAIDEADFMGKLGGGEDDPEQQFINERIKDKELSQRNDTLLDKDAIQKELKRRELLREIE